MKVNKYPGPQALGVLEVIEIPECHKVIRIGRQNDKIVFWALVDETSPHTSLITTVVVGTGHEVPALPPPGLVHTNTLDEDQFVWHGFAANRLRIGGATKEPIFQ